MLLVLVLYWDTGVLSGRQGQRPQVNIQIRNLPLRPDEPAKLHIMFVVRIKLENIDENPQVVKSQLVRYQRHIPGGNRGEEEQASQARGRVG